LRQDIKQMADEIRSIGADEGDEGGVGNHPADDGSNVMEGERLGTISEDFQAILNQVEAALKRLDDGTFGTCQRCGQPIGAERLEAFPYVAYCINCRNIIEREQSLRAGR
jgi:RNA polymerase-binding transcription factor DksA